MSRSGVQCPCCQTILTMEDIRLKGGPVDLVLMMTAVIIDGQQDQRIPASNLARNTSEALKPRRKLDLLFEDVPLGRLPIASRLLPGKKH